MAISLNRTQLDELKKTLSEANLEPKKKQRLLWRLAKYGFIPAVKRYVKQQISIKGEQFEDRKSKRKKPMLAKLPKMIAIKELPQIESVRLYFKGKYKSTASRDISAGVVAGIHQDGARIRQNKSQFDNKNNNQGPATKTQVKKLRKLEFNKPGTDKKASKKWIEANISRPQAGIILRRLTKQEIKDIWSIEVPSREFFGINEQDFSKSLVRELRNIGFGFDVTAQDIKNRGK